MNWNSEVFWSNSIHKYIDKIKLTNDVNKATYFTVKFLSLLLFVKNKKRAPIDGNKIKDHKIGKFIIL